MKNSTFIIRPRDIKILEFLWKWKVSPTAALARKYFPSSVPTVAYQRLRRLSMGKYIESVANRDGTGFLWTLTKSGFAFIRENLPELREVGYGSENFRHDHMVFAAHLGDWLVGLPPEVTLISEQELRRYKSHIFPSWVPDLERRRPDGLWYFSKGSQRGQCIALEVEMSRKSRDEYKDIFLFYKESRSIEHVIWVTKGQALGKYIEGIFEDGDSLQRKHSFFDVTDLVKFGWGTKSFGQFQLDKTIRQIFLNVSGISLEFNENVNSIEILLNSRKRPVVLGSYKEDLKENLEAYR